MAVSTREDRSQYNSLHDESNNPMCAAPCQICCHYVSQSILAAFFQLQYAWTGHQLRWQLPSTSLLKGFGVRMLPGYLLLCWQHAVQQ